MDDRRAPANSMMKSAASLMMDDDIHEIEEGANTSINSSPRPSCLTPGRQALADSMKESITASVSKLRRGDSPTIYIVPPIIRQANEVAYEPQMVSIGPYHNGKERLRAMEEYKWLYLQSFLSRNTKYKLEHYVKVMSELEDEVRSCYYHNVDQHLQVGNEFLKMMVLDACFIVEFFFRSNDFEDLIIRTSVMSVMVNTIVYDLLLLENQIPFFVLQRIFEMAYPNKESHFLADSALQLFDRFMPRNEKIEIKHNFYYHLLHLFHSHLIPTPNDSEEEPNRLCNRTIKYVLNKLKNLLIFLPRSNEATLPITERRRKMIPCATDLQLAGVKFKKNEKSNNILNVKFSHGVLEITPFMIHYHSETLFRNLIAFEQCYPNATNHFTTYLMFMFFVVKTSKDVALLHHNGIIDNYYQGSDDDLANLLHRLCTGACHSFEESYLSDLHDNLQKHCENKWNMWWASLKRDYFTNPWSAISFMAAFFLLLLTITQTFFTIFPRGPSS